jgi:hypothetical protein
VGNGKQSSGILNTVLTQSHEGREGVSIEVFFVSSVPFVVKRSELSRAEPPRSQSRPDLSEIRGTRFEIPSRRREIGGFADTRDEIAAED